jgi:hypothetical protein
LPSQKVILFNSYLLIDADINYKLRKKKFFFQIKTKNKRNKEERRRGQTLYFTDHDSCYLLYFFFN